MQEQLFTACMVIIPVLVHLQDSWYYGWGTSDGTLYGKRYFSCPIDCGLFLSLASVAKEIEWLQLRCTPPIEGRSKASESRGGHSNQLPVGTRAIVRSKDGRQVRGTVRWIGQLPFEGAVSKEEIPVYGIETVSIIGMINIINKNSDLLSTCT